MSSEDGDVYEVVERYFPFDGPHSREAVVAAARGAAELVRYLNNATSPGNDRRTVDRGPTVYRVLGGVHSLVDGLDQLLHQLAGAMRELAGDPTLYDDRGDRPAAPAALAVADHLEQARVASHAVAAALDAARAAASHLGHDL